MIDHDAALQIAMQDTPGELVIDTRRVRELPSGCFFPYRSRDGQRFGGGQGVIVNK
jgi:hypothetical protein